MAPRKSPSNVAGKKTTALIRGPQGKSSVAESVAEMDRLPSDDSNEIRERISARAYALFQERGYQHGYDLRDWLDAERELLSRQRPA